MRELFVDSWLLIAALDGEDEHHFRARRIGSVYATSSFVTHDGIFTEVLAYFARGGPYARQRAVEAVRHARNRYMVVPVDRALFDRGLSLYASRPDKAYSLIDCMSMELMKGRGITHVLTNDHHFRQEGFIVLSDVS